MIVTTALGREHCPICLAEFVPADVHRVVTYVTGNLKRECSPGTVRRWASTGDLTAIGRDGKRKLYNLSEVHLLVTGEHPYQHV